MCDVAIHVLVEGGGAGTHTCRELGFCIREKLLSSTPEKLVHSMYFVPIHAEVIGDVQTKLK